MTFKGKLHKYQEAASRFITDRGSCLLALDLGCGKTVVSLHAIEKLREEGKIKCALLIMSSSLTIQWKERIEQFTDSTAVIIDGSISPKKRSLLLEEAIKSPPDYLILGIRQVISEFQSLQLIKPDLVLVDEVTSIKNFQPQQSKTIKKLTSTYRIGLTAEPIENGKAEELFSIMQWIDPNLFGSWQSFERSYINRNSYGIITGYKNVDEMNRILMTACINKRRTDPDVAEFMPTVEEYDIYVEMDDETKNLYTHISKELLRELRNSNARDVSRSLADLYSGNGTDAGLGMGNVTSRLLALHLLLDSPYLLEASARAYEDPTDPRGSRYAHELWKAGRLPSEPFLGAKLEACVELVEDYLSCDPKHKVIVFARFKGVLPLLAKKLDNYQSVLFTGDLNGKQRGEAIERFSIDPDIRLFLSSDAGGYGVDLYAASHLINFDLPNSSGTFKQRNGRHVRASSTFRNVFIDNLIVENSIEEYQKARLSYKSRVGSAIVSGRGYDSSGRVTNDVSSLTKFLENYLEK
jgi:SNF2 family DNA or RNA helicase